MPSSLNRLLQSRTAQLWIAAVVCAALVAVALWQANRQPRVGDTDIIRVGLVIYNREIPDQFPGDVAMEAGTWWPGYTPAYLTLLRLGFRLTGSFEVLMLGLTALAYTGLLAGFYRLGRKLGLPFGAALLLMLLSGLYQTTALGSAWTGVRLEMAAARNLYLGLLPWLLAWGLWLAQDGSIRAWGSYGFVLGLLANLHSINGIFLLSVIGTALLIAALYGVLRWQILIVFTLAGLPGLVLVYVTTYTVYADVVDATVPAGEVYGYADMVKANLLGYRLPNWVLPTALYAIGTALSATWLMLRRNASGDRAWLVFGVLQCTGAGLLLTADWLVLFAGGMWLIAVLHGQETPLERAAIWLIAIIALLALPVGLLMFTLANSGLLSSAAIVSRALERGGTFVTLPVIVLAVCAFWRVFRAAQTGERWLLSAAGGATLFNGMIQAYVLLPLEGIGYTPQTTQTGQLLPVDGPTYAGVLLLLGWSLFDGRPRPIRFGAVGALGLVAITRLLGVPASDLTALLFGVGCGIGFAWYQAAEAQALPRRLVVGLMLAVAVVLLPVDGGSLAARVLRETPRTVLRNWSLEDNQSLLSPTYQASVWLRDNTPAGSLIVSGSTFLRYWAQRPLVGGGGDADFLAHDPPAYRQIAGIYERLNTAYSDPAALLAFARDYGADYVVAPLTLGLDAFPEAALVYAEANLGIYTIP